MGLSTGRLGLGLPLCLAAACGLQSAPKASSQCMVDVPAVPTDGIRRLALVVGVGTYRDPEARSLPGAPRDARRFYDLLVGDKGYGFPKENVCLLLDADATTEGFKSAFTKGLEGRAREGDVVVVYFSGHGSQAADQNGDEPDEKDETLVLHDSRTNGVTDLVDDEFNAMLSGLMKQTRNVVVILDSCNSGTATRGDAGTFVARMLPPVERLTPSNQPGGGDGSHGFAPEDLQGLVMFAAATDGTTALETKDGGAFTDALVRVLSQTQSSPLFYSQAARLIPPLVAARSPQIPRFHGQLDRPVFGNTTRARPVGWQVKTVGPPLGLSGPSLPGYGEGAQLRIYPGNVSGADARDPAKAKATVVIDTFNGTNADAHVLPPGARSKIEEGDLALLVLVSKDYARLKLRLRPKAEPGGLDDSRAAEIEAAIVRYEETRLLVEPTKGGGDFEIVAQADGTLLLMGPENRVRNSYPPAAEPAKVAEDLMQHARQRALLQLRGENGSEFKDDATLRVRLVPAAVQPECADGRWLQAEPNQEQVVPLCHGWDVEVVLDRDSPLPLQVGGLALSNDGGIVAFPSDDRIERLEPGGRVTFSEGFYGGTPLDVRDHVMVFGTQMRNPVRWHQLASLGQDRSGDGPSRNALEEALDLYVRPGSRSGAQPVASEPARTWTLSTVPLRVEANDRFRQFDDSAPFQPREYTLPKFDVRPYLPDSDAAALYKVLTGADALARRSTMGDGIRYKQHAWNHANDADNLREGIDCSRAIWFAFTLAGLPYNRSNGYLSTAGMVGRSSLMNDQFTSCSSDLRLGDILVYRDAQRERGHVVMVIDPEKRIAWGSHGWDGNVREGKLADTGVEYQLIKYKKDWQRWDGPNMERTACWRYRKFEEEARGPEGQPGIRALKNVCSSDSGCGRPKS